MHLWRDVNVLVIRTILNCAATCTAYTPFSLSNCWLLKIGSFVESWTRTSLTMLSLRSSSSILPLKGVSASQWHINVRLCCIAWWHSREITFASSEKEGETVSTCKSKYRIARFSKVCETYVHMGALSRHYISHLFIPIKLLTNNKWCLQLVETVCPCHFNKTEFSKCPAHILTLNIWDIIKNMKRYLVNSESL